MLRRADLERIANTVSHGNVGHAEILYLQDIVLSTVSRETADELVFKGGTALMKFYQLDRFSEDLDFTARASFAFDELRSAAVRDLENYGAMVAEQTREETNVGYTTRLGIEGPLFTGDRRSLAFLSIEVNAESSVSRGQTRRYTPQFPDVPSFELAVLDEPEILAEKLRALVVRGQPRDLYDIYHLLTKSVPIEPGLVQRKLEYYDLDYQPEAVLEAASEVESSWSALGPLVYSELPAFEDALAPLRRELDETE